jgi:hypothetical protein
MLGLNVESSTKILDKELLKEPLFTTNTDEMLDAYN